MHYVAVLPGWWLRIACWSFVCVVGRVLDQTLYLAEPALTYTHCWNSMPANVSTAVTAAAASASTATRVLLFVK